MLYLIFIFFLNFIFSEDILKESDSIKIESKNLFLNSDPAVSNILSTFFKNDNESFNNNLTSDMLFNYHGNEKKIKFLNDNNTLKSMFYFSNIYFNNKTFSKQINNKYNEFKEILIPNIFDKFKIINQDKFFYNINGDYDLNRINLLFLILSKDQIFIEKMKKESIGFNINSINSIIDIYFNNNFNIKQTISNIQLSNKMLFYINDNILKFKENIEEYEKIHEKKIQVGSFKYSNLNDFIFYIFPLSFVQYIKYKNRDLEKKLLNKDLKDSLEINNKNLENLLKNITICHETKFNDFIKNIKDNITDISYISNNKLNFTININVSYLYFIEKFVNLHLKKLETSEFINFNITEEINKICEINLNLIK